MNIRQKLLLIVLLLAVVPAIVISASIGYFSISSSRDSLQENAQEKLISIRDARQDAIETYFGTLSDELSSMSNNLMVIDAMKEFGRAFGNEESIVAAYSDDQRSSISQYYDQQFASEYGNRNRGDIPETQSLLNALTAKSEYYQAKYISRNPNPLGSKDLLDSAGDGTEYSNLHNKYHPVFRDYLKRFGLYDIFLVDSNTGEIVYSVYKEIDYATSLISGPFREAGIGKVFRKANTSRLGDAVQIADYAQYLPSYDTQAVFIATPIFDKGQKVGVLIYQAPIDRINAIMTLDGKWAEKGLGASGETYLVGPDNLLRNESRFLLEDSEGYLRALASSGVDASLISLIEGRNSSIGLLAVDTPGTQKALAGESGFEIFPDYRNVPVLSAFTPINVLGTRWALMSEIDVEEAFAQASSLTRLILIASLLIAAALAAIAVFVGLRFVKTLSDPIAELDSTVRKLSAGDLDARVDVTTQDELGDLGNALNGLMDDKVSSLAAAEQENERLNNSIINLIRALNQISDKDFTVSIPVSEDIIGTVAASLNTLTEETSDVLKQVAMVSDQVLEVSGDVNNTSNLVIEASAKERDEILETVRALGDSSVEMDKIAEDANNANLMAQETIGYAKRALSSVQDSAAGINSIRETIFETEKRIKRLGDRSQEISGIVNLINNIAERTHILALNASMHAASAGEAGRGFAVVANEVQRLAENAKQSTEEISTLANSIRTETFDTVTAMNKVISQVAEGTKLAEQAGVAMEQNENTTASLVEMVKQIAGSAIAQAKTSNEIRDKAIVIEVKSRETEKSLNEQKASTEKLTTFSEILAESVGVFKLPQ
ncbi:MAG: methyl-accepting chemotaxis protein [Arenicella sp.]|nr:methyl-accepting chemotaxis protein [Arenicella sp.]